MDNIGADKIKEIAVSLIEKLGVSGATVDVSHENDTWKISIESSDEHALIGPDNDRFDALTHLVKRIIAKDLGDEAKVTLDVNGIRAKNEQSLKTKASIIADRARAFKIDVEMDPMSSYERMIVHSHLEGAPNIKTESVGEGKNRRLVIKYIGEA